MATPGEGRIDGPVPKYSRRQALSIGGAAIAATTLGVTTPATGQTSTGGPGGIRRFAAAIEDLKPAIKPRSEWGADLAVTGEILPEEDVRFLLVHHTASTNDYGPDQVIDQIRGFHTFHTGPEKGWPDVAYNFFIDRFGGIWEARAGSIAGPVRGDATGGSQGHALLCSLIGDHSQVPISPEAQASLTQLLAWLGARYEVDTNPGTTVDFVSRGSNRWPEGETVTARTISGHREMSTTSCPGDFAFSLLEEDIPTKVTALRSGVPTATTPASTNVPDPTTATTTATATALPTSSEPVTITAPPTDGSEAAAPGDIGDDNGLGWSAAVIGVVAAGLAGLAAASRKLRRQTH